MGPTVCDDDGPMPILKMSKTLSSNPKPIRRIRRQDIWLKTSSFAKQPARAVFRQPVCVVTKSC